MPDDIAHVRPSMRSVNKAYHRQNLTHRAAVHVLEQIADELLPCGASELIVHSAMFGNSDGKIYEMLRIIRGLKADAEKLWDLRRVLGNIIN